MCSAGVGVPFKRFGKEQAKLVVYLKRSGTLFIEFEEEDYVVTIENVYCFPQCFAAVADRIGNMHGRYDVADIGSWTKDIICIDKRKMQPDKCVTVPNSIIALFQEINAIVAEELERTVTVEEPEAEMFEVILEDEYLVVGESKSVYETSISSEPDFAKGLAELQSRFICLQYEFQYNLDKISDLDYEHRYRNPEYTTYQYNVARIMDKSSYINQWTKELAKCGLFQKDLKNMYKEQIEVATIEVKRIEEENKRILDKAGCRSESELYAKQQAYDKNWSLCNTLAERNRNIKAECERIAREYEVVVDKAEGVARTVEISIISLIERQAEKKAKASLQKMYGKDFLEYGFQDACIKAEMQLQNEDKDRSYERGVLIR